MKNTFSLKGKTIEQTPNKSIGSVWIELIVAETEN